ncbi:MAG: hypothetical protein MSS85_07605 [Pyramidobacter sp.]|uniref:hypothetical protein n=1 Tax=Pyramidobacter sp. TaxID=1943581 RepID=UPI0025E8F87C|nr:hypothetical protein [Pyramidobacter sp.]MCI7403935.1 hypothetical protein [Pyramidobacter sp.]
MRARNIKPGFFKNENLGDCSFQARLLFIGLWCLADREGRLEDRPKKIHAEIFPYDQEMDTESCLVELSSQKLIVRYKHENQNLIWIPQFSRHQNPHPHEAESILPPYVEGDSEKIEESNVITCHDMPLHVMKCNADSLIPDSLKPESLNQNQNRKNLSCPKRKTKREKSDENDDEKKALPFIEDFEAVWEIYPKKLDKKQSYNCYVARRRAGTSAEELYTATQNFAGEMKKQNRENRYIMSGKTFFGVNDRWLDYARPQTQATTPQLTGEEEYMRDALGAGLISSQQYDDWRRKHNGVQ